MADLATRTLPLSGFHGGSAAASVSPAAPASRLSLRAKPDAVPALSTALGVNLPTRPKASSTSGSRHALWIGPDEWLIIDETEADLVALGYTAAEVAVLKSAYTDLAALRAVATAEQTVPAVNNFLFWSAQLCGVN